MSSRALIASNVALYGVVHALVDAACAALVLGGIASFSLDIGELTFLVILYNVLAFGLQSPLGLIADNLRMPVVSAVLGCIFIAISMFTYQTPLIAICFAGVGNALFHVGGGIISLNLIPGKAAMPGIYVAPGALGLTIGILIGKGGYFSPWIFSLALMFSVVLLVLIKRPQINYNTDSTTNIKFFSLIILLLLISISIRSLMGLVLNFPWKSNMYLLIILTAAVVLGKALGGIIGDKFGWERVATIGLVLSAPLLSFGMENPYTAIIGIFLFNMTMPVTLVAIANMFPGRAGFAFGLTTLALIIGALPTYTNMKSMFTNAWVVFVIVLISAVILWRGLKLYNNSQTNLSKVEKTRNAKNGSLNF